MPAEVRKAPAYLENAVMYQIFLRPFTPGGTLNSAAEMLPHLASLGVDILYLCPVTEADAIRRIPTASGTITGLIPNTGRMPI